MSTALDSRMQGLIEEYGRDSCRASLQRLLETDSLRKNQQDDDDSSPSVSPAVPSENVSKASSSSSFPNLVRQVIQRKRSSILENERRLKEAMLDSSFNSMFAVNGDGIVLTANKSALQQFRYEDAPNELIGQNINVIVGGGHAPHHDQYMADFRKRDPNNQEAVYGMQRELSGRRKDGTEFPCVVRLKRFQLLSPDSGPRASGSSGEVMFFASVRDITEEKEARRLQLHNEKEQKIKAAILDTALDGIFATDERGTILLANKAAQKILGYWNEDKNDDENDACLIGKNVSMLVGGDPKHKAHHDEYIDRFVTGCQQHSFLGMKREVIARRKDGSEFHANLGLQYVTAESNNEQSENLIVAFLRDISVEKRATALEIEKRAAEQLLLNMLPREIAMRLKDDPKKQLADHHLRATILFADIVGFTKLSSLMEPIEVVQVLNDLFTRFDALVGQHGLNKVKTIGDCYMVTSIPGERDDTISCRSICHFAFDMIDQLQAFNEQYPGEPLNLRVGVNCGPVVAGVVGTKRFLYDIWGDAVNLASRMESTGIPGRIQITKDVVALISDEDETSATFRFESRGEVEIKGKGTMETFWLTERVGSSEAYRTRSDSIFDE